MFKKQNNQFQKITLGMLVILVRIFVSLMLSGGWKKAYVWLIKDRLPDQAVNIAANELAFRKFNIIGTELL